MKLIFLDVDRDGEGYYILFVNDIAWIQGDDYHDKINHKLEGIVQWLDFRKEKYNLRRLSYAPKDGEVWEFEYQARPNESFESYFTRVKQFLK